jgi:septum formation protein
MLEAAGVSFAVADAAFDEEAAKARLRRDGLDARQLALALAEMKASSAVAEEGDIVLGSDQTLELDDGIMLDKPASRDDAMAQLRMLSGRTHRLHSGAVLLDRDRPVWRKVESVEMTMRALGDRFLTDYLDREYEAVRHGVGGYRIEGLGAQLFERIEGSHFAILGLPLLPLLGALRERGMLGS